MPKLIYAGTLECAEVTDDQIQMMGDAVYRCEECDSWHIDPGPDVLPGGSNAAHVSRVLGYEVRL